jgi:hypothetical protein
MVQATAAAVPAVAQGRLRRELELWEATALISYSFVRLTHRIGDGLRRSESLDENA